MIVSLKTLIDIDNIFFILSNKNIVFQDPATPIMEGIIDFHHYTFFFLIIVLLIVVWMLLRIIYLFTPKLTSLIWSNWWIVNNKSKSGLKIIYEIYKLDYKNPFFMGLFYAYFSLPKVLSDFAIAIPKGGRLPKPRWFMKRLTIRYFYISEFLFDFLLFIVYYAYQKGYLHIITREDFNKLNNTQKIEYIHNNVYKKLINDKEFEKYFLGILIDHVTHHHAKFKDFKNESKIDKMYFNNFTNKNHGTLLEIIWTIIPSGILMLIALPSFALLYSMDEVIDPALSINVIGHQWYWSYEYKDYSWRASKSIAVDSYLLEEADLFEGEYRLLEVDERLILPVNTHIRVLVTASDVIHSWAVPSLGIKIDAIPGRLNQTALFVKREGVYYGQCSEICGVNHGFMPIVVEVVPVEWYCHWINAVMSGRI